MVLFQFTHHESDWNKVKKINKKTGNTVGKIPNFYPKIVETSQKKDTRNTAHFSGSVQAPRKNMVGLGEIYGPNLPSKWNERSCKWQKLSS